MTDEVAMSSEKIHEALLGLATKHKLVVAVYYQPTVIPDMRELARLLNEHGVCFRWTFTIGIGGTVDRFNGEYSKGIGHGFTGRLPYNHKRNSDYLQLLACELLHGVVSYSDLCRAYDTRTYSAAVRGVNVKRDLKSTEIIAALLRDAECASGSFDEFCDEFGYDTDSRKALATYLKCQETRVFMQRALGSDFRTAVELCWQL